MDRYKRQFRILHHEAGPEGELRLAPLFDLFQDAAAEHASILGCGMDFLRRKGLIWVLSRISLEVIRMPKIGETVTVETYPSGVERLFALRQFTVTDADGNVLVRASSCWLLLSIPGFRPRRIEENLEMPLPRNEDLPRHFAVPDRPVPLPEKVVELVHTVRASQIDVNGHLNNAFFAAFVHDLAAELTGVNHPPRSLQLYFQHAGMIGDRILCRGGMEKGEYRMEGCSPDGRTVFFQAQGTLYRS